ncbi:hypothetical protein HMPREF0574_0333 [Mobiluncus curtisii subsp. curtisii ATCC 35241]|uniref:Gram-positive signal peptide protein, YSIRK family n=3 Tax=Actinomycetaceae TaxID=2049 RepID=E6M359_9ACTO|nr:hypothetical protein HMPREF0574_0333 [Mobiluncus curtisii subsp. curtisii ATCC 35241]EFU82395.1 hypothetical protein HMPREF0576_0764 [Mobiluncus holmesii ATCC 35242]MCU9987529.1 DUF3040 domain-containing protein [Mobiluncus curtisii]MCV0000396.1 DUF3040 domain-containing protein [Mobiluncus curtisii]MCV0020657.1 DUF3040 domain-containing protein [Mobiluncus curtisii]
MVMALSDYEKQVLAQMEAQLHNEDPRMADRMRQTSTKVGEPAVSRPRRVAFGVVLVLIGATVLIGGLIATPYLNGLDFLGTLVGVLGFVVIVLGFLKIFGVGSKSSASKPAPRSQPAGAPASRGSFMDRQNERWERRQQGE